ncbi:hypothetical protein BJX61DRAFT_508199 [Aspergillus egyptiacus]|nr:hypothetical protein BJX61DRAFT_508199 [Aspergillus egyptiacus]
MHLSILALAAAAQTTLACTFAISLRHGTAHGGVNEVKCTADIWESNDVDFWNDRSDSYTDMGCHGGCHYVEHKGHVYEFCFDTVFDHKLQGEATLQRTTGGGGDLLYIYPGGEEYDNVASGFLGSLNSQKYYLAHIPCPAA